MPDDCQLPPPIDYNRMIAPGSEELAVRLMQLMFPRIEDAWQKLDGVYVQVVEPRSSLRLDDRYLGRWRSGGLHVTAMFAAVDALMAVQTILKPVIAGTGSLPMSALFPMIRAAIESASLAIYLLEPLDRDERLRRSYLVAAEDAKYLSTFGEALGRETNTVRADAQAHIRELLATRPSIEAGAPFAFERVQYSDLVENADAVMAADPATPKVERMALIAWWKLLSGLSHGKQWAFVELMERSEAVVDEANESAYVKLTSSAAGVAIPLQLAVEALEAALRLFGHRSKEAWNQREDASEPIAISFKELRGDH